jgi:hypothetical protein
MQVHLRAFAQCVRESGVAVGRFAATVETFDLVNIPPLRVPD